MEELRIKNMSLIKETQTTLNNIGNDEDILKEKI